MVFFSPVFIFEHGSTACIEYETISSVQDLRNFMLDPLTSSHESNSRQACNTDWHVVDNLNQLVSIISVLENHILDPLSSLLVNGIWKLFSFFFDELELFGSGWCGPCFVESPSVP